MNSDTKKISFSAIMLAVGILLPLAFHAIPNGGTTFSPMHLPVFITGFICGPMYGALIGLLCPLTSFLFTGMPGAAYLPNMMAELFVYGATSGLFFRFIRTGKFLPDVYVTLVCSMLAGRIVGGFVAYLLFLGGTRAQYSWSLFFSGYFVACWPAIIIQLLLIPTVVMLAKKYGFINEEDRYSGRMLRSKSVAKQKKFFNGLAENWRKNDALDDDAVSVIFENIALPADGRVLDVGCGTGVIDGYLLKKCRAVDAIDLSDKMIEKAKAANEGVNYQVADFYEFCSEEAYDAIIVFDAYPHFMDKRAFMDKANSLLKADGTLWIVFDESRDKINGYHTGRNDIADDLLPAEKEAARLGRFFRAEYLRDDGERYILGLKKRTKKPMKN